MSDFQQNSDGINSLGGFAYQIKVFVLQMLSMNENMQTEFETIDDIATRNIEAEIIDDYEDSLRTLLFSKDEATAFQVKRTSISLTVAKQIFFNWILLENSTSTIKKYVLITDNSYNNKDKISELSFDDLYEEVLKSKKSTKSTIEKVKKIFENDKLKFIKMCELVRQKYSFNSIEDIDNQIDEKCKIIFKKTGVTNYIYNERIKELLKHITVQILEKVKINEPYKITYNEMMSCTEEICCRFTDNFINPSYSEFKKISKINSSKLYITSSREYKQLLACELTPNLIDQHLLYKSYYENYRYGLFELNKPSVIKDIEETTYENFENVKFELLIEKKDTPFNRLKETKNKSNQYAENEQIRYGSGIFLTREEESEHQISWEDKDNEHL